MSCADLWKFPMVQGGPSLWRADSRSVRVLEAWLSLVLSPAVMSLVPFHDQTGIEYIMHTWGIQAQFWPEPFDPQRRKSYEYAPDGTCIKGVFTKKGADALLAGNVTIAKSDEPQQEFDWRPARFSFLQICRAEDPGEGGREVSCMRALAQKPRFDLTARRCAAGFFVRFEVVPNSTFDRIQPRMYHYSQR